MPEWLPEKTNVNPWTEDTYEMLYEIFCRDIRDYNLWYIGNNVWIFPDIEDGKEKVFWHLTTRSGERKKIPRRKRKFYPEGQTDTETERLPDLRRCERLLWVKPLIEHPSEPVCLVVDIASTPVGGDHFDNGAAHSQFSVIRMWSNN